MESFFYEAGQIELEDDLILSVDKQAIIYLEKHVTEFTIWVADPLYRAVNLQVTLNKILNGKNITHNNGKSVITIDLPQEDETGSSVQVNLTYP